MRPWWNVSGQLKVAPEHVAPTVLKLMGKPRCEVFKAFCEKYARVNQRLGKDQYLVPYFISSHPGCDLSAAIELAEYLRDIGHQPEQVQDFIPTPGTLSTTMFYTGLNPLTMERVYVPRSPQEKAMQRALLQYKRPQNHALVRRALHIAGREDLIGYGKRCLVPPACGRSPSGYSRPAGDHRPAGDRRPAKGARGERTAKPAKGAQKPRASTDRGGKAPRGRSTGARPARPPKGGKKNG